MRRQVVLDDQLTPQVQEVAEIPEPGENHVRVRVTRAGVNFWEVMQRRGRVPVPDHRVPGSEGVGVVDAVGAGVEDLRVGQRVAWSRVPGSYADIIVAPTSAFVPVPETVSDEVAAALLFQGTTAHYLCHDAWQVRQGDTAVVTAAAGGVGVLLTQLLVAQGARVIGLVSTPDKAEVAGKAGAFHVLTYGEHAAQEIRELVPEGTAAVYDAVGAGVAEGLLSTLRPRGAMVLYGSSSGRDAAISASDLGSGSFFLTRTAGRDYLGTVEDVAHRSRLLLDLAATGVLQPTLGRQYSLADAGAAWDALESRSTVGKLLIAP